MEVTHFLVSCRQRVIFKAQLASVGKAELWKQAYHLREWCGLRKKKIKNIDEIHRKSLIMVVIKITNQNACPVNYCGQG